MFFRRRQFILESICVLPQSSKYQNRSACPNERMSLCISKKGSFTVEAALLLPFVLMVLINFFSFFQQYAAASELKVSAAAEAKKIGILMGCTNEDGRSEIVICRSADPEYLWAFPFVDQPIVQKAVCRAWVGFTGLQTDEVFVYMTSEGSVYHLYPDCTHLDLSIQQVSFSKAVYSENLYGEPYEACRVCKEPVGLFVYITDEGNRYHSDRACGGLKRTVRQVPISQVADRGCCMRCMARGE